MLACKATQQLRCCCQQQPLQQQLRLLHSMHACHAMCGSAQWYTQTPHNSKTAVAYLSYNRRVQAASSSQRSSSVYSKCSRRTFATTAAAAAAQPATDAVDQVQPRLPVTVISGFLGEHWRAVM
jgi:hypothetical protein